MAELVDLLDCKQADALVSNTNEVTLVPACMPKVCSTLPLVRQACLTVGRSGPGYKKPLQ